MKFPGVAVSAGGALAFALGAIPLASTAARTPAPHAATPDPGSMSPSPSSDAPPAAATPHPESSPVGPAPAAASATPDVLPLGTGAPLDASTATPSPPPPPPVATFRTPGSDAPGQLDAYGTVAFALGHAPTLLQQRAAILSDDATFTRDRATEYPSLGGSAQNQIQKSSNLSGQFAQFGISPVNNFSQNTAQLQSTYNLYNGGQQLVTQQARRTTDAAKYELRRLEEQLAVSVSNAFYTLAAQHAVVVLDENDLRFQQTLLANAQASERVGRVAGVDVLKAQVAVARSESALVQARVDEQNARESLAVQIGAPTRERFVVPEKLPEPPEPKTDDARLGAIAKLNRPEVLEAKATFDASKLGDAAVDNDLRPTVAINGAFGSQVSPTSLVQQQQSIDQQNALALQSYLTEKQLFPNATLAPPVPIPPVNRERPGFWQFNVTSTFAVPLYDWGQRAAAHHAARAAIVAALASLDNAYDAVQADVNAASRNLGAAAAKLALAKESAALGRETARISQLQYRSGLSSFTDVTQTEQTALSAENDLIAARVQYVVALIRLRVALAPPDTAAAADLRGL